MYRIHFNANGALGTERAVLEIGATGCHWRFDPDGSAAVTDSPPPTKSPGRGPGSPHRVSPEQRVVMRDFAARWPAYERQRRIRRWKAELAEAIQLIVSDVRERLEAMKQSLPLKALPLPLEIDGAGDDVETNPASAVTPLPAPEIA